MKVTDEAIIIEKNALTHIIIQKTEFKGKKYLGIREFYLDDEGTWRPSKKGINISMDFWPAVKEGLEKVDLLKVVKQDS